jgi:hypothetical protein
MAACAQIINADFDDLKRKSTTATGAAGTGEGGAAGTGGSPTGAGGDEPDAAGSGGGGAGNGGMGGTGGSPEASAGASGTRDSGPDVVADVRSDTELDRSMPTDGPRDQFSPDVVADVELEAAPPTGVVLNEINAQGALEDYIELYNLDSTPFDLSGYSVTQAMGMFGLPDSASFLTFADGTMLGPREHLLIVANQGLKPRGGPHPGCEVPGFTGPPYMVTSCYWVEWGISKSGERVYLMAPGGAIREYVDFPIPTMNPPPEGRSYGRLPNGIGPFQSTAFTPEKANQL